MSPIFLPAPYLEKKHEHCSVTIMRAFMEKASFAKRFLMPVSTLFIIAALCFVAYEIAPKLGSYALHQVAAGVAGFVFFLCVWFGTLFVYPVSYFRGASTTERIVASLIIPFLYATKEVLRISMAFTLLESLYFYLSVLSMGVYFAAMAEMGLSEMIVRRIRKKRGEAIRVFPLPAILCLVLGISTVVFVFAWGNGEYTFYVFLQGFRKLFGSGIGV